MLPGVGVTPVGVLVDRRADEAGEHEVSKGNYNGDGDEDELCEDHGSLFLSGGISVGSDYASFSGTVMLANVSSARLTTGGSWVASSMTSL